VLRAQKQDAPLLQIADACAMVIRHCLEERVGAQTFINVLSNGESEKVHMFGTMIDPEFPGGFNILTFITPPSWTKRLKQALLRVWRSVAQTKRLSIKSRKLRNPSRFLVRNARNHASGCSGC
jgi:hypothetical protein